MDELTRLEREAVRLFAAAKGRGCGNLGAFQDVARRQGVNNTEGQRRVFAGQASYDRQTGTPNGGDENV